MAAFTAVAIALTVASTAMSMYSADTQAKQQESNLKFQASQGEADARAAQGDAIVEAERIRKAAKSQRATATAQAAASGVDVSSPTAVRIDEEITKNSESDALMTILNGGDRGARLNQQASIDKQSASLVKSNAKIEQGSLLLSGASKAYGNWKTG